MSDVAMITSLDEFEEEYRKGIGRPLAQRWTTAASLDNIRRWGDGAGDYNPLWRDPDYAARSRFGMVTAPPTFIYAVSLGVRAAEDGAIDPARLSTTHFPMNYAGGEIVFHRTIWRGDVLTAQEEVGPIVRKHSERIGPFVINTGLVQYYNQRQELVASKSTRMARYQNLGSGTTIEYDREPRRDGAGEAADPLVWERTRRGAEPRYWEDVSVGDHAANPAQGHVQRVGAVPLHARRAGHVPHDAGGAGEGGVGRTRGRGPLRPGARDASAATCPASSTTARSASAGWRRS